MSRSHPARRAVAIWLALTVVALPVDAQATPAEQSTAGPGQDIPGRLLVTMHRDVSAEREVRVHAGAGGRVVRDLRATGLRIVEIAPGRRADAIRAYLAAPEVVAVEPDRALAVAEVPNDPMYPQEWGLARVQAAQAWDVSHSSSAVKVAILDCGIFAGHPDVGPKVVLARDFTGAGTTNDGCDHGTHVAGIAAATVNNGVGVAGLGRDAAILNGKVIRDDGTTNEGFVVEGLIWAADNGARVINLSLAGQVACSLAMQNAIDYAWGAGAVIAAAAGNLGIQGAATPGNCNHVLAVAATDQTDARAAFSNFGATTVDLAAPGVGILSTDNVGDYVTKSGTSMATPFVAGLAALVWTTPWGIDNQAVVDRLTFQADPISGTGTLWQYGRINAARAVGATPSPVDTTPPTILGVLAGGITATGATITWATNEVATSQVEYGPTTAYGSTTTLDPTLVTLHTQTLSGLTAGTLYHYRVRSTDAAGNLAVSTDSSFSTTPPPVLDTTPPVVSSVGASAVTSTGATITWATDEVATSQVEYGPTTAYGSTTTLDPTLVTLHAQTLSGLAAGTLYHYRVRSTDAAGNLAVSADATFSTSAAPIITLSNFRIQAAIAGLGAFSAARGDARFEDRGNQRLFRLGVQNVNLPSGTVLDVVVGGVRLGSMSLVNGAGRLDLDTKNGDQVPLLLFGSLVEVNTGSGVPIASGRFS